MRTQPTSRDELNAFVDGELELSKQLELEARLQDDAALRAEVDDLRSLREAVRGAAEYHAAPAALRARLDARSPVAPGAGGARAGGWRAWFAWRPLVPAGALAGLVAIALSLGLGSPHDERDALLLQEVIAGHVRASIGERLVDVASSDQHTVKPWLSARLDYSPPVSAAPEPGTTFVGGRIDYLDGRQVATLVYRRRQHVIDAYVWPGAVTDSSLHAQSLRGFNSVHWSHSGMNHWLVSDINRDELLALARAIAEADPPR